MVPAAREKSKFELIAESLSPELIKELVGAKDYTLERKDSALKLVKKLLVECEAIEDEVGGSIDYLQCQVEHNNNQERILAALQHQHHFEGELGDLRHLFHDGFVKDFV